MVLTCSHLPKDFLTRWKSIGGKCKDGSPIASGPPLCRSSPQNHAFRHSQFSFRIRGRWLLLVSSPPRRRSTPPRPASTGPFQLYSRPGHPTLIGPCAHAWLLTSCHSTGKLRSTHQQKLFFASRASCASDAWDAPDVNRDSRGNSGSALRPDAIPPVTLRPGAILTSIPCVLDVLIPPNPNPLHPDAL